MMRKAVVVGLGSHATLAIMGFMLLSGSNDVDFVIRAPAIIAISAWTGTVLLVMLLAHRCWEDMSQARKIGITALALPGWTVGLPLVVLYFLRSSDGADWDGSSE